MAPKRLERNITCLDLLSKVKKSQRDALINTASKDQILCICDCANNFLNENIPFTEEQIRKLQKYKNQIRYLAKTNKGSISDKKKIIVQNGGFLPLLLTPILSIAGSLLADAISGKK